MRHEPWWLVWTLIAVFAGPSWVGFAHKRMLAWRARRPAQPDVILPVGWKVWHRHSGYLHHFEWTGHGWKRMKTPPISIFAEDA